MTRPLARPIEMVTPPSDLDPLVRAKTYPYDIPAHSYLFENGSFRAVEDLGAHTAGLVPILACGSNRAPAQLARKYHDFAAVSIPVERAWLADFDVVYAAHITGYGSVAANLQHVPGARVEVSITWLGEALLERMDATEGRGFDYDFARLEKLSLATEGGALLSEAYAYVYRKGCLRHDGDHAGIAEIASEGRRHASFTQPDILRQVQARLGGGGDLDGFIRENIQDTALRYAREARLQEDALPNAWPHVTVID